jgi:hypothetical protein
MMRADDGNGHPEKPNLPGQEVLLVPAFFFTVILHDSYHFITPDANRGEQKKQKRYG